MKTEEWKGGSSWNHVGDVIARADALPARPVPQSGKQSPYILGLLRREKHPPRNDIDVKWRTIAADSALGYTRAMQITNTFIPNDRADWRGWLKQHGSSMSEIWVVYHKAGTGRSGISYNDSLEEALCFGWVDSLIQKIDEEKYARKFTPRKAGSKWSELNKHLVAKLVQQGHMTAAGLAKVDFRLSEAQPERPKRPKLPLPDWLKDGLMASPAAWENFQRLAPSHQRNYIGWISDAKREETRQRRIQEAIQRLEKNETLESKFFRKELQ